MAGFRTGDFLFRPIGLVQLHSYTTSRPSALSQPAPCYRIDFRKDTQNPTKTFIPFHVNIEGRLDGFLGWCEAKLCEGVTLSNSPYLPVLEQPHYRAGETTLLCLDPNFINGEAQWKYAVQPATATAIPFQWL